MAVVIVAIPSRDDYIWKISSEKIPHMTLMMLGDQLPNLSRVQDFISHVVDSSLCKFTMIVDHRGELGDQSADVLFFRDDSCTEKIEDFRSYLLGNVDIRKSYNSVEQYDEWTPHLTLGYPATPAKPDDRDYPGTSCVVFDRIGLWTDDYEGNEFLLETDETNGLYMSSLGENFLQHYGVKGMHWGVSRSKSADRTPTEVGVHTRPGKAIRTTGGKHHGAHEDALNAAVTRQKARKSTTDSLSSKELQTLVNRMNLEQQYNRLNSSDARGGQSVQKFLKKALGLGKTANDLHTFANSPAGKTIKVALKAKTGR